MGRASSRQTKDLVPSSRKTKELTAVSRSFSRSVTQKRCALSVFHCQLHLSSFTRTADGFRFPFALDAQVSVTRSVLISLFIL